MNRAVEIFIAHLLLWHALWIKCIYKIKKRDKKSNLYLVRTRDPKLLAYPSTDTELHGKPLKFVQIQKNNEKSFSLLISNGITSHIRVVPFPRQMLYFRNRSVALGYEITFCFLKLIFHRYNFCMITKPALYTKIIWFSVLAFSIRYCI